LEGGIEVSRIGRLPRRPPDGAIREDEIGIFAMGSNARSVRDGEAEARGPRFAG